MSEETKETEVQPKVRAPIKLTCDIPGREEDFVLFKGTGWKFKHLRLWESLASVEDVVRVIIERIQDWHITDADGKPILFNRDLGALAFDELEPEQAAWVTGIFRIAYAQAGMPDPNS